MWQLKLFGGFKVEGADALTGRAAQRKRQALLVLLGSGPNTHISRDKIVALLWPETDTDRARHQLASSLYDARRVLGDDAILATGDDLSFHAALVRSDVREFEAAIQQGDFDGAAALRTGPFLDGFHVAGAPDFERWVDGERDRLDRLFYRALENAANECNTRGDDAGAARWLRQLATHEPYNSRVALLYMEALAKSGDAAGALRYGRTHELLMQEEFGTAADAQIGELMEKLRATPPPQPASPRPAPVVSDADVVDAAVAAIETKRSGLRHLAVGAVAATALIIAAFTLYARPNNPPERSIAVLPFSTISANADSTYIADGVHEEILAHLAKIPDLKVISRTSVTAYRDPQRNLREIAQELDVAFVMEGSVRRDGNRVRVVAQLINARTDQHVWADTYDRELTDLFAIQNEIAEAIAKRLHTDRPVGDRDDPGAPPTTVTEAYDEYLRARSMIYSTPIAQIDYPAAQARLERAIQLDPKFALAHAELTRLHASMYFTAIDPSPARAEAAERALATLTGLAPQLAETHLAIGYYQYFVRRDLDRALNELSQARALMPGSAEVLHMTGIVMRRRAQLDSAIYYLTLAAQRDPARSLPYTYLAESLHRLGRFSEADRIYRQALALAPNDPFTLRNYGDMYVAWRGETDTLRAVVPRMAARGRSSLGGPVLARYRVAMLERNCAEAAKAVSTGPDVLGLQEQMLPRALYRAWAAECSRNEQQARRHYQEAERVARRMLTTQPPAAAQIALGHALVGLGRLDEGVAAGRKALSLIPFERDAFIGSYLTVELAALYARAGRRDEAVALMEEYNRRPLKLWPHELRLNPRWDALRDMARFQALAR